MSDPERTALLRKLKSCATQYRKATERVAALTEERGDLLTAARQLDPPITWQKLAEMFGVTEAAVMQKVKRHNAPRPEEVNGS